MSVSMKDLLEAGVNFGHSKGRWNPKMSPYLYGVRNNIHIVDLGKTVLYLEEAYNFVSDAVSKGAEVLFVGTKKQAKDVIEEEAKRCESFYVNERWVGGLLTNFKTVRKSIAKLRQLERMEAEGIFEVLPKKEVVSLKRETQRLQKLYSGIVNMDRTPDIIWVVDTNREHIAVQEARRLGIKVVAIADSNCDPDEIDYLIPGNDDAIKSIKLLTARIADAVIDGKQRREANVISETSKRKVVVVAEEEKELFERAMAMSEKYEDIDKDSVDY